MKEGLLLKDAPEGRFELYCNNYNNNSKEKCNILFNTIIDYNTHMKKTHHGWMRIIELSIRPKRRFHTNQVELDNIKEKKCWCGSKQEDRIPKYSGKYCSKEHYTNWWTRVDNISFHRDRFLSSKPNKCEICNVKANYREMDHIIAVVLCGHPWDYRNLQALCSDCHKVKTKSDMGILAWWKREMKYDIGIGT